MISITREKLNELTDNASDAVQDIILSDEIDKTTAILGKVYRLPISSYVLFKNVITLTLLGAVAPEDVVTALEEELRLSKEDAYKLAQDLEKSIFEKARIILIGKISSDVVNLEFESEGNKEELRKKIMDTTKRDSGFAKNQGSSVEKKSVILTPGSRSQLLEQLQVLDAIPDDDEVASRLHHIREQIQALENQETDNSAPEVTPEDDALIFQNKGAGIVEAVPKAIHYSKAPTKYNIDPYREVSEV